MSMGSLDKMLWLAERLLYATPAELHIAAVQVRANVPQINMSLILAAMDKIRLGLTQRSLDDSPAKLRMATVQAGRAVAIALTPGMPPMEHVSIKPRGGIMGRILFQPQVSACVNLQKCACSLLVYLPHACAIVTMYDSSGAQCPNAGTPPPMSASRPKLVWWGCIL